jgi:hypothetical protein
MKLLTRLLCASALLCGVAASAADSAVVTPTRYAFNVTWQKEKTGEKKFRIRAYSGEEEQWVCKFKVTSLSNVPLADMEVRYQIHLSLDRDGRVALSEIAEGTEKISSLPVNRSAEITTKSVPLLRLKLDSNYITTDNSRPNKRDSIKGVAVGLFHRGVLVHEFRSPGVPNAPFKEARPASSPK